MQCLHAQSTRCSVSSGNSNKQGFLPCCRLALQQPCSTILLPAATASQARRAVAVAAAKSSPKGKGGAAAGKGFGPAKPQKAVEEGCPCGSNQYYKRCCKPYHTGTAAAPTVEATIRARFSAILKKDISYLLKTSHPDLHTFMYGSEPGQSLRQLQDDLWNTADHYEYSDLKIRSVQPGEQPDEALAVFQYTVYDLRTPLIDDQGNKSRTVQIEQSRFLQDPETKLWRFADYKLVEVPEALARTAEIQAKDMAAAKAAASASASAGPAAPEGAQQV